MSDKLVSIIIPSYNHSKYIERAILSLLNQTYTNIEIIIIDDGSKDNSVELIKQFKDKRITFIEQVNQGVSSTLNKGIALAKGDYICFLDSDDCFSEYKIEKQVDFIEKGFDIVSTKVATINGNGQFVKDSFIDKWFNDFNADEIFGDNQINNFLYKNYLCKSSLMLRKEMFEIYGMFDTRLITVYDFHLWLKMIGSARIGRLDEILTYYRWHGENETLKNSLRMKCEITLVYDEYLNKFLSINDERNNNLKEYINSYYSFFESNNLFEIYLITQIHKTLHKEDDVLNFLKDNKFINYVKEILEKKNQQILNEFNSIENPFIIKKILRKTRNDYTTGGIKLVFREIYRRFIPLNIRSNIKKLNYKLFKKNNIRYISYDYQIKNFIKSKVHFEKNKINILFLFPWMVMGGGDKVNLDIAKGLNKDKYSLHYLTFVESNNEWSQKFEVYSKNIFHLPQVIKFDLINQFIVEYIKQANIKIIFVSNTGHGYDSLPYIRHYFGTSVKVVDLLHGQGGNREEGGFPKYSSSFDNYIDTRIVINNYLKNYIIEKYKINDAKIKVIYNGIEYKNYIDNIRGIYKNRFYIKKDSFIVTYLGRLSYEKHPEKLIDIAKEVIINRGYKNIKFFIAGNGELYNDLKDLIENNNLNDYVFLTGYVDDTPNLLMDTNVLLIMSEMEGLPIVALEAMSAKVPVIATKVGGIPEIIDNKTNGFLVNFDEKMIDEFANHIIELYTNKSLYNDISNNAFSKIKETFSYEKMINNYTEIIS